MGIIDSFKRECVPVFKFRSKFGPQLGAAWRHQKCGGSCDDSTVVFCRCITNLRLLRASKYFCIPCSFRFPALIRGVFELVSSLFECERNSRVFSRRQEASELHRIEIGGPSRFAVEEITLACALRMKTALG